MTFLPVIPGRICGENGADEVRVICDVLMEIAGMSADEQAGYLYLLRHEASLSCDDLVLSLFKSGDLEWLVRKRQALGSCQRGRA